MSKSDPLPPGSILSNRYEIVRMLGAGGLGEVYECFDKAKNTRVAVKRLHEGAEDLTDPSMASAQEAQSLSSLRHPNIVRILDLAWDKGSMNIIMELVEGQTLANVIKSRPLPINEFISLAMQTLEGLGAAHRKGILHLDIKPANLMLEPVPHGPFRVKLLDFGLAQLQHQTPTRTKDGSIMGSIYFIAPEQLHAAPLTEQTDFYALGHVFYNAICGQVAFPYRNFEKVVQAQLEEEPVPLIQYRPDLDFELSGWIHSFLQKDPNDRPPSAQDALRVLTHIISNMNRREEEKEKKGKDTQKTSGHQTGFVEETKSHIDSVKKFFKGKLRLHPKEKKPPSEKS